MKSPNVIALSLLLAATATASERPFTAASVPHARLKKAGKVVISNDGHSITAYRFFGNIREALVSLRSARVLGTRTFAAVYDSRSAARVPKELDAAIHDAARAHGVDPRLLAAVARRESGFNARIVSNKGACGVMQLMPATAEYLGVR
ncbi:MAG TPA: transglycosylase SLT domain-containing protein, partial [Thermoanaerobaculia bacterium]|nr:transglycosylase SLT domain-containing protein [Thermoanaerobaculia bacterium]